MKTDSSPPAGPHWMDKWFRKGVALVDRHAIEQTFETLKVHLEPHQMTYLQARWLHMLLWWTGRAAENKWKYQTLRCFVVLGGVFIPALVSWKPDSSTAVAYLRWATVALGLLIAVSAGLEEIFHFGDIWREKRGAAELLKVEGWRYFELTGPYKGKTHQAAYPDFVASVEALIEREIKDYLVAVRPAHREPDQAKSAKAPPAQHS